MYFSGNQFQDPGWHLFLIRYQHFKPGTLLIQQVIWVIVKPLFQFIAENHGWGWENNVGQIVPTQY